jgi:hypothetical protein
LLLGGSASAQVLQPVLHVMVSTKIVAASYGGNCKLDGADTIALRKALRLFPYTSYCLVQHDRRQVDVAGMEEFPVPGQRQLLIQPTGFRDGRVSLDVMLMEGRRMLLNTALKLKDGGEFLVAGPQHEDGVLFLAIGASIPKPKQRIRGQGLLLQQVESR